MPTQSTDHPQADRILQIARDVVETFPNKDSGFHIEVFRHIMMIEFDLHPFHSLTVGETAGVEQTNESAM